jgi:DNA-binding protein HU-beta
MTKGDLVKATSEKAGISQAIAPKALDAILEGMKDAFGKGESVTMVGFGTLKVVERAAREGRNLRTGETIKIPARKTVRFSGLAAEVIPPRQCPRGSATPGHICLLSRPPAPLRPSF